MPFNYIMYNSIIQLIQRIPPKKLAIVASKMYNIFKQKNAQNESGEEMNMQYDFDYEIYKYIDEQANNYVSFKDFLKNHNITFDEAWHCVKQFKEKFNNLLSKYSIGNQNLAVTCYDLMERIIQQSDNPDLHYLYFCIMTDFGLLNDINSSDHTKEHDIRNYFRQKKLIQELSAFLKYQTQNSKKLAEIREYLKKPRCVKNIECMDETDFLYHPTFELYRMSGNSPSDNSDELIGKYTTQNGKITVRD